MTPLIVALLILTSLAPAQLPTCTIPDAIGVNIHFTDPAPGEMKMLADAGFKWVRMDFDWNAIEKSRGQYDFSAYDGLLAALEKHQIRAVLILDYSNKLYDADESPHSDEAVAAFAKWAARSVMHFKGRGAIWEMYNEPNIQFWRPRPDVQQYIKLALATGKAIKSSAPDELYVGPAQSGFDRTFLEACFKAGLLEYWDAVSVHPYGQEAPESRALAYSALRILIDRYKPKGRTVPILSGEWGYSSIWSGLTPELQGKYLAREMLTNLWQQIPLSIWYDWHDDGRDPKEPEHHFGTITYQSREPKRAYLAAKTLTTQLHGFTFNKRLALENPKDFLLIFTREKEIRLVAWTTARQPHKITLPIESGSFTVTSHLGQPLPKRSATKQGVAITLTDSPQYLVPDAPMDYLSIAAGWERLPTEILTAWPAHAAVEPTIQNPLDRPLTLVRDNGTQKTVAPHRSLRDAFMFQTLRIPGIAPQRVEYDIKGMGKLGQTLDVTVSNPLIVTPMAPTGTIQPVRVENPSGEAGEMLVRRGGETSGGVRLRFASGEQSKIVEVPGDTTRGIEIYSSDGAQLETAARGCRFVPIPLDLEKFELRAEGDPAVTSTQRFEQVSPQDAPVKLDRVFRITYDFAAGWKYICLKPRGGLGKLEGKPLAVGMWLKGDGSGNIPRLRFTDSTGQTFQPDGQKIDYTDWRYLSYPLDASASHWGGANDGIIHDPIRLETVLLIDSAARQATRGQILVAAPSVVYLEE